MTTVKPTAPAHHLIVTCDRCALNLTLALQARYVEPGEERIWARGATACNNCGYEGFLGGRFILEVTSA